MREGTKIGRTAGGVTSLEGQLLSTRTSDLFMRASFHCSGINSLHAHSMLVLHEQTRIAATRLVWTAVILHSNETSSLKLVDHFQNSRVLKMTVKRCI